jgi:hypothetical protein
MIDVQARAFRRSPPTDRTSPTLRSQDRLEVLERDAELPFEVPFTKLRLATGVVLLAVGAYPLGIRALPTGHVGDDLLPLRLVPSLRASRKACLAIATEPVSPALRGVVLIEGLQLTTLRAAFHCSIIAPRYDSYALFDAAWK